MSFITVNKKESAWGYVLFMCWVGALVYFVNQADGFLNVVLAFLKACVWPAMFLFKALELMQV